MEVQDMVAELDDPVDMIRRIVEEKIDEDQC